MASKKDFVPITYRETLQKSERLRYDDKLKVIGNEDPYEFIKSDWTTNVAFLPSMSYFDLLNYLVFSPSPYTMDDLKSYKGLDAYNQFVCGWVRDKQVCLKKDHCVVSAKVMHSQRMRATPLNPWIIAEKGGRILAAHCDCMAGLGEACTHVAALLFAIEATVKIRDSKTVTEEKAYWLIPGGVKGVTYKELYKIDFTSAKTKKKLLDISVSTQQPSTVPIYSPKTNKVPVASKEDMLVFCSKLHSTGKRAAILTTIAPFSESYIPKALNKNFPNILTDLFNEECYGMNYCQLVNHCESIIITVTEEQAQAVESATTDQASSKLWYRFRSGRITASRMKAAFATDPASPALSLVRSICNPESITFFSKATHWGCEHERMARDIFFDKMSALHDGFVITDSGLIINPDLPHLGASPDGMVWCDCCGEACLEIKCPFCKREKTILDSVDKQFCLQPSGDGTLKLSRQHAYFFQVQAQLAICKKEFCYFVVWTEQDMHVEIVYFDNEFWSSISSKITHFFKTAILPELVGKFYSRLPNTSRMLKEISQNNSSDEASASDTLFCYCEQVESGDMVGCDNTKCNIKWFHFECVNISKAPKSKKWYCPDCRKLPQFKRGKKCT